MAVQRGLPRVIRTDKHQLLEEWKGLLNAVDAGRKFGVRRSGLCLLVAYLIEGIQRRV